MKNGEETHSTPRGASGNSHSRSRSEEPTAALIMMENSEQRRGNVKGRGIAEEEGEFRKRLSICSLREEDTAYPASGKG